MVGVAQLVEPRIVIPVVVGSSPIVHPIFEARGAMLYKAAARGQNSALASSEAAQPGR
jgi:hypothetical protein